MLGTWIVRKPEYAQIWQPWQVSHFLQVTDIVFPNIDLRELGTVRKVFKRRNFIMGQRDDFKVGKLTKDTQVIDLEKT